MRNSERGTIDDTEHSLIWHYTDSSGLLGIVNSGALWATSPQYLNDTQEVEYGLSLAKEVLSAKIWEEYEPHVRREIAGLRLHIACFSQLSDSLAQWRSYGGNHQGYALAFSRSESFGCVAYYPYVGEDEGRSATNFAPTAAEWLDVVYEQADQRLALKGWEAEALPAYYRGERLLGMRLEEGERLPPMPPEAYRGWAANELAKEISRFKHPGFYEEREVRLFWSGGRKEKGDHLRFRVTPRGIASYVELRATHSSLLPIKALRAGPGPNQESSLRGALELLEVRGYDSDLVGQGKTSGIPFR